MELTKEIIFQEIKDYINKEVSCNILITKETKIQELGLDSLDLVDLVFLLEKKINYQIPDEYIIKIKTINDLIEIVFKFNNKDKLKKIK